MKRILVISVALLSALELFAVRAYPYPVTVQRSDGTALQILIHGDETGSWKTTLDGTPVVQNEDGTYSVVSESKVRRVGKQLFPLGGVISNYVATKATVNMKTIVIPVQFQDLKFTKPQIRNSLDRLFNELNYSLDGATGSVKDYFRDNLGSFCNLSFDVCDIVTLPNAYRYYGENSLGTDKNVKSLVSQACAAAHSAGVDFSRYDFDRDGYVDNVFIIFAGHNEAEGGGDDTLWPQSWNVSDQQIFYDGVKISNFSLYSEYRGASGYNFAGIGTICHEYCHFLGLCDLYDVNGDEEGLSKGVGGSLSIMDYGNYNNDGLTPPYLTVFERQMLGLVSASSIRKETRITVNPVWETREEYRIPAKTSGEYYSLEYRDGTKWDEYAGGDGLVVYHIDKSRNIAGSMSAKMRWEQNAVNGYAAHPCVEAVSSTGGDAATAADLFFPGRRGVSAIGSAYNFPLMEWSGAGIGYGISDIVEVADGISLRLEFDQGWDLPLMTSYSVVPGQTTALLEWEQSKPASGQWNIILASRNVASSDTVVVTGATRYNFSNLNPGENYYCNIFYSQWSIEGKRYRIEFSTVKSLNSYPLIGEADRTYLTGDSMRLAVLNLTEPFTSISWTVNGQPCEEGFTFPQAGSYRVCAIIVYEDGSSELLTKIIKVKDE